VIASDLAGNRDIIESGIHGFLVSPTPQMLATSIEMLLRDEGMRRRFGAALQEKVMADFSITHMNDETFALYGSSKSFAT
jgi:glycosyltransferase involved in cell wall biosynthesis